MKRSSLLIGAFLISGLMSCSTASKVAYDGEDDVYGNMQDLALAESTNQGVAEYHSRSESSSKYSNVGGDSYFEPEYKELFSDEDDYYDEDHERSRDMYDYQDYEYSARLRRFHNPAGIGYGYYDPFYTDLYWYDPFPQNCGVNIIVGAEPVWYSSSNFWVNTGWAWNWWGPSWNIGCNWGRPTCGGGRGNPYGWNNGFAWNKGYWNGHNNGYWDGFHHGNMMGNANAAWNEHPRRYYGPRSNVSANNSGRAAQYSASQSQQGGMPQQKSFTSGKKTSRAQQASVASASGRARSSERFDARNQQVFKQGSPKTANRANRRYSSAAKSGRTEAKTSSTKSGYVGRREASKSATARTGKYSRSGRQTLGGNYRSAPRNSNNHRSRVGKADQVNRGASSTHRNQRANGSRGTSTKTPKFSLPKNSQSRSGQYNRRGGNSSGSSSRYQNSSRSNSSYSRPTQRSNNYNKPRWSSRGNSNSYNGASRSSRSNNSGSRSARSRSGRR